MPEPLAMPANVTVLPSASNRATPSLGIRSVVIIACSALLPPVTSDVNSATASFAPSSTACRSRRLPITPVEPVRISAGWQPSSLATEAAMDSAATGPSAPTQALALPLLITIPRAWPAANRSMVRTSECPFTKFLVNTPAATAGSSLTTKARSLLPFAFRPQATPAARKPGTEVTLPFSTFIYNSSKA